MQWKEHLRNLEHKQDWDEAIAFMQQIIKDNPNNMDAYLFMNYLLMNLLVEEDYDRTKEHHYRRLLKQYFDESYTKFSDNAEYLYLTGKTAVMCELLFGIDVKDYEAMIEKAKKLDPSNLVYKENYYWELKEKNPKHPELIEYCKLVLSDDSPIKEQLKTKGALGEYLLELKTRFAEGVLWNYVPLEGKA